MAHVGSPDAFFTGKAGPYDVRVTVRLPGVIPGRAQVAVRLVGASAAANPQVSLQAAQWNVGLTGAPPPEPAVAVPGNPDLYAAELWLMTASSYQLAVHVTGAAGSGTAIVPVMAIATAERPMPPWLGWVLAGLGLFLTVGFMTIIGCRRARERAPARCRARQSSSDAGPDWHRGRSVGGRLALVGWQRVVGRRGFRLQPQRALSPICCRGAGNRAGREATADAGDSRPAVDRRAQPGKPL